MSSIVHLYDKRSGITYVYQSTSYWDKSLKQSRSRRKLIGRLDPETGEVVPTSGRRGRLPKEKASDVKQQKPGEEPVKNSEEKNLKETIVKQASVNAELSNKIEILKVELQKISVSLSKLLSQL